MIQNPPLELLEFNKLLKLISDSANSEASARSVKDILPLSDKEDIEKRLAQISEIRKMSHEGKPLKLSHFSDISPLFAKIRPEGAVLEAVELADFIPFLYIASAVSSQIEERFDLPFLRNLTAHLTGFPDILTILTKSIDSEGNILDSASHLLADLRTRIRKLEGRIRKQLEEIVKDERLSVFLQDEFITTRSGRWVIPVRMDSKGMVHGVVHDVSKSGETAFIEPLAIINLANELENLIAEQKAEEIRILRNICSKIRLVADDLEAEFMTIVYLDVLGCIAKFSDLLQMESAGINDNGVVSLIKARHPLLQLSLQKNDISQQVVPLDISLGGENTVMVITGANAGGKTIAIKTIGLLLLMALSGMPVPADSQSEIPMIQNLLVDIGDEQSIENNLSTFSAHISNISGILRKTGPDTVILIDELGTGTDPEEGAALACAILNEITKSRALVFATTHLSEIKGFVHRSHGMINASMEFDQKTLTPLYRLRIGEPGQSHALSIAQRYGMPENVINTAKGMLGSMKIEFDRMIADLNAKRSEYENLLAGLEKKHAETEEKNALVTQKISELEKRQKEILAGAYKDAADIVLETRIRMNELLDEIKKKEKTERRKILREVEVIKDHIAEKLIEYDVEDKGIPSIDDLKKGDIVYIRSLGYDAPVIELNHKNNRIRVAAGNMEIEVPLSDTGFKKGKPATGSKPSFQSSTPEHVTSSRLNLVGMRVDEALSRLEQFLNHALLAELREVTVIHGIGKGLLMKAVHEHLDKHPLVKSFRKGTQEEGGNAITVVRMQ